ncbi:type VII secretion protein EccB [Stackebrandtia albiflava]|uniref:Type VII secretion protein EccB n=1 Tax=Stackebrandtia albiflava TaxID=406432 RepID=A0A562UPF6_9ACTN|nr:type VII secretion protein EccB [Stackebrandtia albiflava]TWJ07500.1 type VII secretion protein EccB [Stackebrandtia albiflava]
MATRRDQLQSYQFLLQRVVSALVYRRTDPAESPFRRAGGAVFAGIMISILALAVTALIGLFASFGKDETWWKGNFIVLEEETGTKYVVFPSEEQATDQFPQKLYPVTNFASAALLAGTTATVEVSQRSLTGEGIDGEVPPRGMPVGIVGAPDSLPLPEHLLAAPLFTVCTDPTQEENAAISLLYVGERLTSGTPMAANQALLINEGEEVYLVSSGGYKHLIPDPELTLSALGLASQQRAIVAPAFTKSLPSGENLEVPAVSGMGEDSGISGAKVGQVIENTAGGNTEYYVALRDGAAPISPLQAELFMGATGQSQYLSGNAAQEASASVGENLHMFLPDRDDEAAWRAALPTEIPTVPDNWAASPACVGFDGDEPGIELSASLPVNPGIETQRLSTEGEVYADRIVVPPGRGMLVRTGGTEGAFSLIVGGQNFPIVMPTKNEEARYEIVAAKDPLSAMGYEPSHAVVMSAGLLSLVPQGAALDPQAAIETAFANDKEPEE